MPLNIYKPGSEPLRLVLARASGSNATWVIPDLQRPYVWKPEQVIRLLDSILKGWPFGTLLLLDTGDVKAATEPGGERPGERIPFRGLWTFVDRWGANEKNVSRQTSLRAPPTSYTLVLDGQQRLQSLALALGDDGWGFRLSDAAWQESLELPATAGAHGRWTDGQVHLDLTRFAVEQEPGRRIAECDFERCLVWVRATPGQNHGPNQSLAEESPLLGTGGGQGHFIRLGRLWERAVDSLGSMPDEHEPWVAEILAKHEVPEPLQSKVRQPLKNLLSHLSQIADTQVHYLQLYAQREANLPGETYDDAVVNVFARLNSAGRALSRQEITFAWIKRKWDRTATSGVDAGESFANLRHELSELRLSLDDDQLVSLCAATWCTLTPSRAGRLLRSRDLMRADQIKPLAAGLSANWGRWRAAFIDVASRLKDRDLVLGEQVLSFNAIVVLALWVALAREWGDARHFSPADRQALEHHITRGFDRLADRWLMCARWGRVFQRDTAETLEGYTTSLATTWTSLSSCANVAAANAVWVSAMEAFAAEAAEKAIPNVCSQATSSRGGVSQYASLLWVWNRLSAARWESANVLLRTSKRQRPTLHVDHLVPWAWLSEQPAELFNEEGRAWREIGSIGNDLGNMAHLKSSLNQQKSDQTLGDFLGRCADSLSAKGITATRWQADLDVGLEFLNGSSVSPLQLRTAIEERGARIRQDLVAFCEGRVLRVDIAPA